MSPEAGRLLRAIVAARLAFLVVGGTGSGKTTLLAALLGCVPAGERIVCVEEAPELAPGHPHVVRLTTRQPNVEGAGEVTLRDLVRQALRMRPDRLVVGEVRGAEVCELLAALEHRPPGWCRHPARELSRRGSRAAGGAGRSGRHAAPRVAQPTRRRRACGAARGATRRSAGTGRRGSAGARGRPGSRAPGLAGRALGIRGASACATCSTALLLPARPTALLLPARPTALLLPARPTALLLSARPTALLLSARPTAEVGVWRAEPGGGLDGSRGAVLAGRGGSPSAHRAALPRGANPGGRDRRDLDHPVLCTAGPDRGVGVLLAGPGGGLLPHW